MAVPAWMKRALLPALAAGGMAVVAFAQDEASVDDASDVTETVASAAPLCADPAGGVDRILQELSLREARIEAREQALDAKLSDLHAAEEAIAERVREAQAVRAQAEEVLDGLDEERAERVKGLAKRMEAMKSKSAAEMFTSLFKREPATAVTLLKKMSTGKAGKMMSSLDPDLAARVGARATEVVPLEVP